MTGPRGTWAHTSHCLVDSWHLEHPIQIQLNCLGPGRERGFSQPVWEVTGIWGALPSITYLKRLSEYGHRGRLWELAVAGVLPFGSGRYTEGNACWELRGTAMLGFITRGGLRVRKRGKCSSKP